MFKVVNRKNSILVLIPSTPRELLFGRECLIYSFTHRRIKKMLGPGLMTNIGPHNIWKLPVYIFLLDILLRVENLKSNNTNNCTYAFFANRL